MEYHYADGLLVGQTVRREPEFDAGQVAILLAHERAEADRGPHGFPMSEAASPDADPNKPGGWHYVANKVPRVDYAAKAEGDARDAYYKQYKDANRNGHVWYTRRVDD